MRTENLDENCFKLAVAHIMPFLGAFGVLDGHSMKQKKLCRVVVVSVLSDLGEI